MTESEKTLYNRICNELFVHTELYDSEIKRIAKRIIEKTKHVLK